MRVLLVDADHREGDVVGAQLEDRGHTVLRCFEADEARLCRGVYEHTECPLEGAAVDVAVLIREPGETPPLREMGAVCALRHRIPVVEAYAHDEVPFGEFVTPAGTAVVEAVEAAADADRPDHASAIAVKIADLPAVARLGSVPPISVSREPGRLLVDLSLPAGVSDADVDSLVTWAARAAREYDGHVKVIDVTVTRC